MKNYNNGIIYGIICKTTNNLYIGSTVESTGIRLAKHRYEYKNTNRPNISSRKCFINDNYKIITIEKYPCNNQNELQARESLHIIKNRLSNDFNVVNNRCPVGHKKMVYDLSSLPCRCLT